MLARLSQKTLFASCCIFARIGAQDAEASFRNSSPGGVRFLSLKWKALLLTSLVLVAVTVSYTGLNYFALNQQFQKRRIGIQQEYARQVQGLLGQSSQRLRQLGTVLASLPEIQLQLSRSPSGDTVTAFDRLWTNLALDRDMQVLILFSDSRPRGHRPRMAHG